LNYQKATNMKKLIQVEAIVPFLISITLINLLPISFTWWVWILLFLAPDISMLGYILNNKVGAITYNIFHHQLIAVVVAGIGFLTQQPFLELAGLILLGHSSLDRVMGYGLKLSQGFKYTHLGAVGQK